MIEKDYDEDSKFYRKSQRAGEGGSPVWVRYFWRSLLSRGWRNKRSRSRRSSTVTGTHINGGKPEYVVKGGNKRSFRLSSCLQDGSLLFFPKHVSERKIHFLQNLMIVSMNETQMNQQMRQKRNQEERMKRHVQESIYWHEFCRAWKSSR